MPHRKKSSFILIAIVLLTLLARVAPQFFGGIWADELFTLKIASFPLREIGYMSTFDCHPPLFYDYIHLFMRFLQQLGDRFISLGWLRSATALPSVLLTLLLGGWAWRAWGRGAGLTAWSAALLTPAMAFYAAELRNYSLVTLLVAASSLALFRGVTTRSRAALALYPVLALLAFQTHYQAVFIILLHGLWTLYFLWRNRRLHTPATRLLTLAPLFVIATCLALQFQGLYEKQQNTYPTPATIRITFWDLPAVLLYDFPAGAVERQSVRSPYGVLATAVFAALFLALLAALAHRRRDLKRRPDWSGLGGFCLFMLLGYLGLTWTLTWLNVALLFSGGRLATLALPFWILLVTAGIERIATLRARQRARRILVNALLPGMALCLVARIDWRDDFLTFFPNRFIYQTLGIPPKVDFDYVLADDAIAPWLRRALPETEIKPLQSLLQEDKPTTRPLKLLSVGFNHRLNSETENLVEVALHTWGLKRLPIVTERLPMAPCPVLDSLNCATIPAHQRQHFNAHLRSLLGNPALRSQREPDRLMLHAHAAEFSGAMGLYVLEPDRGNTIRWTNGERVSLQWPAPERPGEYQVQVFFSRPCPLPSRIADVDTCFPGRTPLKTMPAPVGPVVIRETIRTTRPFEPVRFMLLTTPYITRPSRETGRHSLMFQRVTMNRVPASNPPGAPAPKS